MKTSNSIPGRLGLLLISFFMLVSVSAGVTFWGIETQRNDALLINLAGRQRMLVQLMTRLAGEIQGLETSDQTRLLHESLATFESTLGALQEGGLVPYTQDLTVAVPAIGDPETQALLRQVRRTWNEYQVALEAVTMTGTQDPGFNAALGALDANASLLVAEADGVVRQLESVSNLKLARLRTIQLGFLGSALFLLGAGGWITYRSIIRPLQILAGEAERIGEGNLSTPVNSAGLSEIQNLSSSLETMRRQLKSSRAHLIGWAETLESYAAQRTRELEALYEVSHEISSRLDVNHVLDSVVTKARELLNAETASLCLVDESGHRLEISAHSGPAESVVGRITSFQGNLAKRVLASDRAMICADARCSGGCGILAQPYRISHLAAPLRVGDRVIGALCVGDHRQAAFSKEALDILTKLANSAAIALENARLYDQAERVAILEERQRIAAEMHDGLGQTLSYLSLIIDQASESAETRDFGASLEQLRVAHQTILKASDEVRAGIAHLMEMDKPAHSLQDQLVELVEEFTAQRSTPVTFRSLVGGPLFVSRRQCEQVLRVTREALTNAERHAQATQITVQLSEETGGLHLAITDDGQGFDPVRPIPDGSSHFGLPIMRARANRIQGRLNVQSAPGAGTTISLIWPLDNPQLLDRGYVTDPSPVGR